MDHDLECGHGALPKEMDTSGKTKPDRAAPGCFPTLPIGGGTGRHAHWSPSDRAKIARVTAMDCYWSSYPVRRRRTLFLLVVGGLLVTLALVFFRNADTRAASPTARRAATAPRGRAARAFYPTADLPVACQDPNVDLVVAIPTRLGDYREIEARQVVRETWADARLLKAHGMCLVFFAEDAKPVLLARRRGESDIRPMLGGSGRGSSPVVAMFQAIAESASENVDWVVKAESHVLLHPGQLRAQMMLLRSSSRVIMATPQGATARSNRAPARDSAFLISRDLVDEIAAQGADNWWRSTAVDDNALIGTWLADFGATWVEPSAHQFAVLAPRPHGHKHDVIPASVCTSTVATERAVSKARVLPGSIRQAAGSSDLVFVDQLSSHAMANGWANWATCGSPCGCKSRGDPGQAVGDALGMDAGQDDAEGRRHA
ncbi:hypothetical protein AMAG_20226 [Allomyces macrogynus ATCC 38327]|uniref:Uncharacterized protein n=1 Tax=Allomyces macrogynus (strain ATCC 38327) TaxID=578462 RepID=A0A0L0T5N9_ALLM3|nr:hypothetical protein AMAG_20226 [Allomyces macrogynus ATCC 38327]|eukprot:KNE70060.1 hypothetical protein AMAG_20226 [Allomyces macrogynus ATCC 38327]